MLNVHVLNVHVHVMHTCNDVACYVQYIVVNLCG